MVPSCLFPNRGDSMKWFKRKKENPIQIDRCNICKLKSIYIARIFIEGEDHLDYIKLKLCEGCKNEINERYNQTD